MDSHSRGNDGLPKGFLLQAETTAVAQGTGQADRVQLNARQQVSSQPVKIIPQRHHLIARAYSEPLGFDLVEQMLLQREFIID